MGIVNLLPVKRVIWQERVWRPRWRPLGGSGEARNFPPSVESLPDFLTVYGSKEEVASQSEMLRDGTIGSAETLGLAWRFKPRHAPFPLPGGLVGVFRAIVYVSVLPVLHTLEHLPLRGAIAVQLVGDNHPWDVLASAEALPAERLGCRLIPSALPQEIEPVTVLLHCPPQLMARPMDRQKDRIAMPRVAWSRAATAHLVGLRLPTRPAPRADRFVRHEDTTREPQCLDVAVAEAEPVILPDTMADAHDRAAMLLLAVGWG
jgi:hypothetical protein